MKRPSAERMMLFVANGRLYDCTRLHTAQPLVRRRAPVPCALCPVTCVAHGLSFALATPTSRYAVCNIPTCPWSHAQSLLVWPRITHLHVVVGWCPQAHRVAVPKASRPSMQCQVQMPTPNGPVASMGRWARSSAAGEGTAGEPRARCAKNCEVKR